VCVKALVEEGGTARTLTVVSSTQGIAWQDVTVTGCDTIPTGNVTAGQLIEGCQGTVTVAYTPTNTLLYTTDF